MYLCLLSLIFKCGEPVQISASLLTLCLGKAVKEKARTLELKLARTTEELQGLKVRQQELETQLSQAQCQNVVRSEVRATPAPSYLCLELQQSCISQLFITKNIVHALPAATT